MPMGRGPRPALWPRSPSPTPTTPGPKPRHAPPAGPGRRRESSPSSPRSHPRRRVAWARSRRGLLDDPGGIAVGAADAVGPAEATDHLVASGVVDNPQDVDEHG